MWLPRKRSFIFGIRFGLRARHFGRTLAGSRNTFRSTTTYGGYYGGYVPVPPIHILDEPILRGTNDEGVIEVDLRRYVTGAHRDRSVYEINVVAIEEESVSALATPWSEDNPFVTVTKEGRIEYRPRGTYLWNVLEVEVEVSDPQHPASPLGQQRGAVYRNEPVGEFVEIEGSTPAKRKFQLVIKEETFIGDPTAATKIHDQGFSGECAETAVATSLAHIGAVDENGAPITYQRVRDELGATYLVDLDGTVPPVLHKDAVRKGRHGKALYVRTISGRYIAGEFVAGYYTVDRRFIEVADTEAPGAAGVSGYWPNIDYGPLNTGIPVQGRIPPEDINENDGWGLVKDIFAAYGIESRTRYASDFTTLLAELDAGNPVIAYVDNFELQQQPYIVDAQSNADTSNKGLLSSENHAVWFSGVDRSDPDNPKILVNDSGLGTVTLVPVATVLAAWEDGEFIYEAPGEDPDIPATQQETKRYNLRNDMRDAQFATDSIIPDLLENPAIDIQPHAFTPEALLFMEDTELRDILIEHIDHRHIPGFKEKFLQWAANKAEMQAQVEIDWGVNLENVKNIINKVDFE